MKKILMSLLKALLLFAVAVSGFACGSSNHDDTENGSPDVTAPVISGITAAAVTETEAILSWTTDELATSDIVYGLTTGYGYASPADTAADKSGHNVVLSGLSPNTTYHCRVKSRDAAGNEAVSADFTLTTPAGITVLVISGVAHSDVTTSTALITWTTSVVATGDVEYGQDTSYGSAAPVPEDTGADNTSHIVVLTGLDANTTYHYRVKSRNTLASEEVSADSTFTTLPDTASPVISNIASSSITQTTANISWSTNEPATGQVDYGLDTSYGSTTPADTNLITGHSLALSGLAPGTTYHYRVRSRDASNNETISVDNSFTTQADTTAPVISSVASLSITTTSAIITWKTSEPATGNLVYGLTTSYGSSLPAPADITADKKSHSVVLSGLSPGTLYHYQVKSTDAFGNGAFSADESFTTEAELSVHFIDVGQGDAILIDKGDVEVLIDGGFSPGVIGYLSNYVDGPLEVIVATHMHDDHTGGLIEVLKKYDVLDIWHNGDTSTTPIYNTFISAVSAEGSQIHIARRGVQISAGELVFDILNPVDLSGDSNNSSIVLAFSYGDIDFLFTGDAEQEAEGIMLSAGIVPEVEILKVGHHGSADASSEAFLAAASPEVTIYMAGMNNDYGHPHSETIAALNKIEATIYGTDVDGTIIVTIDGTTYDITCITITRSITITNIDLVGEIVTIKNNGSSAVDMAGWRLWGVTGDQTYTFPSFTLGAGATVLIVSGPGSVDNPPAQLKWTGSYIWNNDGDPGWLYDSSGNLVSSYP